MRVLSFTSLYPNSAQPTHGVFVENRLRHLAASGGVDLRVVAPVPWFPVAEAWAGRYRVYAKVPGEEIRHGLRVSHPRFPVVPKVGMSVAPLLLATSQYRVVQRLIRGGFDFDLIDAHYFYPDGVAAALLGRWFGKPVVITGRGTDLNDIPRFPLPRRQIQWAAQRAAGMITVAQSLKDALIALGIAPERVTVLRNGVDLDTFRPLTEDQRMAVRAKHGLRGFALISVGQLIERKGHHLTIEALSNIPDGTLGIAGDGPERPHLLELAQKRGLADRVRLFGPVSHEGLRELYAAADASVLASSREGWANVLLESMACGTPVIATAVSGTPDVVAAPAAGVLVQDRSAVAIAAGVGALRANMPERAATRKYAEKFSWDATTQGQLDLFRRIIREKPAVAV